MLFSLNIYSSNTLTSYHGYCINVLDNESIQYKFSCNLSAV